MAIKQFNQPDSTVESPSTFGAKVDQSVGLLAELGNAFACHEQTTPVMTIRVESGRIFDGTTLSVIAAQSTGTITAPVGNPRIDRVVMDSAGVISVVTGTPAASPAAPAITSGSAPLCNVRLETSSTVITNSMITDERFLGLQGHARVNAANVFTINQSISRNSPTLILNDTSGAINALIEFRLGGASKAFVACQAINTLQFYDNSGTAAAKLTIGIIPLARMASATVIDETGATVAANTITSTSLGTGDSFYKAHTRVTSGDALAEVGAYLTVGDALITQGSYAYFSSNTGTKYHVMQNNKDASSITYNRKVYRLQET